MGAHGTVTDGGGSATLTFLFSDIEGSTRLLQLLGDRYAVVLETCRRLLRDAIADAGGWEVDVEGDGMFAAFPSARGGVVAAVAAQQALAGEPWPEQAAVNVRMGLHTGEAARTDSGYVGIDVHRAARIAAAAHGGQVLLSQTTSQLAESSLPPEAELRDLGEHRLRDLGRPEHLYQLDVAGLPDQFPQLQTLDATPNNLPVQVSTFVGRTEEIATAMRLLGEARLLTLTGPGGTGKTRLSLQAGACLTGQFDHGVWFVPLAAIRDPALVPSAILQALQVRELPQREPAVQLFDYLADRSALLILDNFEQVLSAAPFVGELLHAAPHVRLLVTSRAPLHVYGEQELPIPPLGVPHATTGRDGVSAYEAVTLFIQRAKAARPDFTVTEANAPAVAAICERLDGLPLAIELAASRVKLLTPERILERLQRRAIDAGTGARDLPDRQRTLEQAIAWSYELLDPEAQEAFARLSVFVDGWTLEAVEAVLDGDALGALEVLVDHSLVRQQETGADVRFVMLETIREFAGDRLVDDGQVDAVRQRHADHFLSLIEEAAPHHLDWEQVAWWDRLSADQANCRTALEWFIERKNTACALRCTAALWRFWSKGHVYEGLGFIDRVLALPATEDHPELLAGALEAAGGLWYWRGDLAAALPRYQRALDLERRLGRAAGIANAAYNLSFTHSFGSDPERGRSLLREALDLYTAAGDDAGVAKVTWGLGATAQVSGEHEEAIGHFDRTLVWARAADDPFYIGWSLHMRAASKVFTGDVGGAKEDAVEALQLFAGFRDAAAVAVLLDNFADIAGAEQDHERQSKLSAASHSLQQRTGAELARVSGEVVGRTPIDPSRFETAWREGLALTFDEAVALARDDG